MYISHNNTGEKIGKSVEELVMSLLFGKLFGLFFPLSTASVVFATEKNKGIKGAIGFPHIHKTK